MLTRIACRNKCSGQRQAVGKTGFIVPSIEHPESSYGGNNKHRSILCGSVYSLLGCKRLHERPVSWSGSHRIARAASTGFGSTNNLPLSHAGLLQSFQDSGKRCRCRSAIT